MSLYIIFSWLPSRNTSKNSNISSRQEWKAAEYIIYDTETERRKRGVLFNDPVNY